MRRGTCVKCGAATVRAAPNGVQLGEHVQAVVRPDLAPGFRGFVRSHATDAWTYACTTCGYFEHYLLDPQALAFVAHSWRPVPVSG